jgi:hypothetical protein
MNTQLLIDNYRTWLANTLTNDTKAVIDTLNKNGFPTSYSINNSNLIDQSLKGLQISKSFGDDLNKLIAKNNASNIQNFLGSSTKAGFASQFENTTRLNASNLGLGPMLQYPDNMTQIFAKNTTFDNCANC